MRTTTAPIPVDNDDAAVAAPAPPWSATIVPWLTVALCVAGFSIAMYLTWVHLSHSVPVCVPGGGCETVNSSEYSTFGGIPVALLGAAMYAGLLALTLVSWLSASLAQLALLARFGLALAGAAYSGYLTFISLTVLRATCVWCIASLTIVSVLCLISLWQVLRPPVAQAEAA